MAEKKLLSALKRWCPFICRSSTPRGSQEEKKRQRETVIAVYSRLRRRGVAAWKVRREEKEGGKGGKGPKRRLKSLGKEHIYIS